DIEEQYQQQIETLRTALKEKTKENKRIKSSFGSIKELNYTMKKQLDDVTEQNRRLENQSRKVQARLDNLQVTDDVPTVMLLVHLKVSMLPKRRLKTCRAETVPSPWSLVVAGCGPSPVPVVAGGRWLWPESRPRGRWLSSESCLHGFWLCAVPWQVLPVLVQQLQQTARTEASLQLPLLRFTYYCLSQLEHSTQHPPLTSTLRRLGEEVSCGQGGGDRSRSHPLFKSSCLHTRFLSSLIVLRTVSLATDVLHDDVGMEDGKAFFLKYQALAVILAVLRAGNPSLQVRAMDILLQMGAESRYLPSFLQACSTEQFFRWASTFLRSTRLDLTLAEKLSILLQKLSGIRSNKRLFEAFSLHLLLQEMHRTTNPAHAFLTINLSSILLNLGMPTRP
uniref:Coiled-coil domain-containing protein 138 n=1 Tax=Electrophorus electricus TaxID=8005 RepID=A0A4W4FEM4_ELEEL